MLDQLEQRSVWETIRDCPHPIALYGMGNGAEKILHVMHAYGRDADVIFASNQFVRGHSFLGKKVHTYAQVCEQYKDFTVVMAFGVHDAPMLEHIAAINREHPVLAPDVPVVGNGLFTREFVENNLSSFEAVYQNLGDERSKEVYLAILNYKISGKVSYLYESFDSKQEVYRDLLCLHAEETIVDAGAYDGDTVREILDATGGSYRQIIAIEADHKNFKKLLKNTAHMERITCLHTGVWSRPATLSFARKAGRNSRVGDGGDSLAADSIDHLVQAPVTLLKMDIEGAELEALKGAEETIRSYKPKLYVCAYHRNEDLFTLPLKIWALHPGYRLYFRHSPYLPAWECNFYGIAES